MSRELKLSYTLVSIFAIVVISMLTWSVSVRSAKDARLTEQGEIMLNSFCPPGFQLVDQSCQFRSLYQNYDSLKDQGLGGLKVALPPGYRDGFSPALIDLGRYLFFDPILSPDGKMSCASCHDPDKGFSDGLGRSIGADGQQLDRSAPSLWNVAFYDKFFWDGRSTTLEDQAVGPLFDPREMANNPILLLETINDNAAYRSLFKQVYGQSTTISLDQIVTALSAFQSTLISLNSRYDQYAHGYSDALNDNEKAGLNVFRSFVARCGECHTPPLFTNQQMAVIGTPEPEGMARDLGAEGVTGDRSQRASFKVPSLRNIALTAPYMHSGRFATLREAAEFYTKGRGHAVTEGEELSIHWHIWEPKLTDQELDHVVDFLHTLTDESFKPAVPQQLPSGLQLAH